MYIQKLQSNFSLPLNRTVHFRDIFLWLISQQKIPENEITYKVEKAVDLILLYFD